MATSFQPVATEEGKDEEIQKTKQEDTFSVQSSIRTGHLVDSSVVGIKKLSKAKHRHQTILWSIYILLMVAALLWSLFNTIVQYLDYGKSVQFSKKIVKTDFPAITVCSKTPFSQDALQKWNSGAVPSPKAFSIKMRNSTSWYWEHTNRRMGAMYFHSDGIAAYYSTLKYNESISVSHRIEKLFMFCSLYIGSRKITSSMSEGNPCHLNIRLISHRKYFNCYIIQVNNTELKTKVNAVSLVVNLNNTLSLRHPALKGSFAGEITDHAEGVRVIIHENNIRPKIKEYGVDVEPNTNIEFVYREQRHLLMSTPKDPCVSAEEVEKRKIVDLENTFNYTARDCQFSKVTEAKMENCGCMLAAYVRPKIDMPYCTGLFLHDLERGRKCVKKSPMHATMLNNQVVCAKRCHHTRFIQHSSYSKCAVPKWLLDWWKTNLDMKNVKGDVANSPQLKRLKKESEELGKLIPGNSETAKNIVHITVTRGSNVVEYTEEKMLLTFTEMLGQIGGLFGLYLGLNLAFLIEVLDLLRHITKSRYRALRRNTKKKDKENDTSQNETPL